MQKAKLVPERDLWDGEMRGYRVDGCKVLLVKLDGELFAYEDRCAHLGLALSEGALDGSVITCRAHHYQYCARTGQGINPSSVRLRPLPFEVVDGMVAVDTETESRAR